jgi:hypothetical protein
MIWHYLIGPWLTTNGVIITDAIKYVQGKTDHLIKAERKLLQDIKEDKTDSKDTGLEKTNNNIFWYSVLQS